MQRFLRPVLGFVTGLLIIASLPTYAWLGIRFLGALVRAEVPIDYRSSYAAMAAYCLAGAVALLLLSVLAFAQFAAWRWAANRALNYGICALLVALAVVHFAALRLVDDIEAQSLFIASSAPYAFVLTVLAALHFCIDRLRPPGNGVRGRYPGAG
jgi:hypothetical protein